MSTPRKMYVMDASKGLHKIRVVETGKPEPKSRQIRVAVDAAGMSTVEEYVVKRWWIGRAMHRFKKPLVVGWNFVGKVDMLGKGASDFQVSC
jgi:NADPH:quinone reductase-like Zn-dependent oxidoreductase